MKQRNNFVFGGLFLSAISLCIGVVVSGAVMALFGYNPFEAYAAIFKGAFGSLRGITQTFSQATPLIFTGLAFSFAKQATIINLGIEGQMYMGALGSAIVGALELQIPAILHLSLAIIAGLLFGAAYAGIVGFMKVKFGSNEVIATIMLNSIAILFVGYLLNGPLLADGSSVAQTTKIVEGARLPRIFEQYQLSFAIFLAIFTCIAVHLLIDKTILGFEVRAVGRNIRAAETAGISIAKITIFTLGISGAIAGFAGASHVLGVDRRLILGFSPGYG